MACGRDSTDHLSLCHLTSLYQGIIKVSNPLPSVEIAPDETRASTPLSLLLDLHSSTHNHGVGAGTRIGRDAPAQCQKSRMLLMGEVQEW